MAIVRLAFRRETMLPVAALIFASLVCLGMVSMRILSATHIRYQFLIWNLFLAWLPLVFALLASHSFHTGSPKTWRFAGFAIAWLLFFPNSPYIFTDLIHLTSGLRSYFWVDLIVILSCAFTGLFAGFLSLFLMQGLVQRKAGVAAGWVFIAGVASLSGFGVYIGRFLRFNTWDVIYRPLALFQDVGKWIADPPGHSVTFPVMFAMFLFICYLMLYALTHLREPLPRLGHATLEPQAGVN